MNDLSHYSIFRTPWLVAPDVLSDFRRIASEIGSADFKAVLSKRGAWLEGSHNVEIRDGVAILPITGPIFRYPNFFSWLFGGSTVSELATDLRRAVENKAVRVVVLQIDSPGGQVSGISELADQIAAARKPVIAYVDGIGASAAFWLASSTKKIILSDTAQVGSIGVVSTCYLDRDDSTVEIVSTQSPHKRIDVATDEGRARVQRHTDKIASIFIAKVAKYRGVTDTFVTANFGGGDLLIGDDAVAVGMADRVASLESVIAEYSKSPQNLPRPASMTTLTSLILDHGEAGAIEAVRARDKQFFAPVL